MEDVTQKNNIVEGYQQLLIIVKLSRVKKALKNSLTRSQFQ